MLGHEVEVACRLEGLGASLLQGAQEELLDGSVEKLHRREARAIRT